MEAAAQTVFLVEDEEAILEGIADFLRRRKVDVTTATCVRDAQAALAVMASLPDFVITDVRLPDGNGLDLVRDVTGRQPRPRIIVITGHLDKDAVEHARASGADAVLLKPFPLKSLLAELRGGDPGAAGGCLVAGPVDA